MIKAVIDTNYLIENGDLEKLINEYEVILPLVCLEEIDHLNHNITDGSKKFQIRNAIRKIKENMDKIYIDTKIYESEGVDFDSHKNDNKILLCCKEHNAILITYDVAMLVKAKAMGLECVELNFKDTEYKGYKELCGNTSFINELFTEISEGINKYGFLQNEYLLLYNIDLDEIYEYRYDGKKLVDLKLPPSKAVKGLNSNQRFALDLLNNKDIPIKIIAGGFGSGKTLMAVKTGLYQVVQKEFYKTLLFIRNPIVADGTEIGFLPGDKSEKIYDFCRPFLQYVENEKDQFYAENLIKNEKIKMDVVSFLKGVSIDDSFVIMDEAEDLNTKLIKLVGSRIGANSCVVFTGDWKQSENKYKSDNGLLKLINTTKGNPLVGIIVLEEDVRSSASKIFSEL